MYIRLKELKRDHGSNLLAAYLVESKRIDGKPRQKIVAYLGSIRWDDARIPITRWDKANPVARAKRDEFWQAVETKLASLGISMDAKLIAQIGDKVHRDRSGVGTTKPS